MAWRQRRRTNEEDIELDMVPIMNMFLVLIPFLLLSASFFHIKAINTSVPVLSAPGVDEENQKPPVSNAKVTVIVELKEQKILLTAMCDQLEYDDLVKLEADIPVDEKEGYSMADLSAHLEYIKGQYPKSDTLILVPTGSVVYGTIIQTMDVARAANSRELFPNIVLSGKVG